MLIKDRDLDHPLDTFQQDFESKQLGKEKEKTFKSIAEAIVSTGKTELHLICDLKIQLQFMKGINSVLPSVAFVSRQNNSVKFNA